MNVAKTQHNFSKTHEKNRKSQYFGIYHQVKTQKSDQKISLQLMQKPEGCDSLVTILTSWLVEIFMEYTQYDL